MEDINNKEIGFEIAPVDNGSPEYIGKPRGRPKGSTISKKVKRERLEKKIQKSAQALAMDLKLYYCIRCGKQNQNASGNFYLMKSSEVHVANDWYADICTDCVKEIFEELKIRYKDKKVAFIVVCHYLNMYYDEILFNSLITKPTFTIGTYVRCLNMQQSKNKTFVHYLLDILNQLDIKLTIPDVRKLTETKWEDSDKMNMEYSISCVGYDPFVDENLTDDERKFLFNILSGYFDEDDVKNDSHKIQGVIQLSHIHLQCKKIDDMINGELLSKYPDEKRTKALTSTKKDLLDTVTKIVRDNNLSSNYSLKSQRGSNTLSGKIKELEKENFEAIKVNLFDIKTCEAMKQIANLSNQSILEQIGLDANDYTAMIKEQREMISEYENKLITLEEENRILKNDLKKYKMSCR